MTRTDNFARVPVASEAELWAWLAEHHGQEASVWLVTWKKGHDGYLSTSEVLDALIAHGWIDGIRRKHEDPARTMQLIAPRRTQAWAQSYKHRAAALSAAGRMHPAGEARIAASKEQGLWDFYADVDALIQPDDLNAALDAAPGARVFFEDCAASYRRNVLRWIKLAKTPATRAKRIAEVSRTAASGERIPQM
ncbi:MAG: YdeI/OmpD-associated family protein [Pseudomonadota bacterium]